MRGHRWNPFILVVALVCLGAPGTVAGDAPDDADGDGTSLPTGTEEDSARAAQADASDSGDDASESGNATWPTSVGERPVPTDAELDPELGAALEEGATDSAASVHQTKGILEDTMDKSVAWASIDVTTNEPMLTNTTAAGDEDAADEDDPHGADPEPAEDDDRSGDGAPAGLPPSLRRHLATMQDAVPEVLAVPGLTVPSIDREPAEEQELPVAPSSSALTTQERSVVARASGSEDAVLLVALSGVAVAAAAAAFTVTGPGSPAAAKAAGWVPRLTAALRCGIGIGLYARLSKDRVLDHGTRNALVSFLQTNPGACMADIRETVDASLNTIRHHLEVLRTNGLVVDVRQGRRRCFFLAGDGHSTEARLALAALSAAPVRRVYAAIRARPGIRQQELAAALGVTPTSVIFHARRLEEVGVVRRQRDGREMTYFPQVRLGSF